MPVTYKKNTDMLIKLHTIAGSLEKVIHTLLKQSMVRLSELPRVLIALDSFDHSDLYVSILSFP